MAPEQRQQGHHPLCTDSLRAPWRAGPVFGIAQGESHHKRCSCNLKRGNLGGFSPALVSVLHTLELEKTPQMGESERLSPGRNGEGDTVFGAGMGCDTQAGFPAHSVASRNLRDRHRLTFCMLPAGCHMDGCRPTTPAGGRLCKHHCANPRSSGNPKGRGYSPASVVKPLTSRLPCPYSISPLLYVTWRRAAERGQTPAREAAVLPVGIRNRSRHEIALHPPALHPGRLLAAPGFSPSSDFSSWRPGQLLGTALDTWGHPTLLQKHICTARVRV